MPEAFRLVRGILHGLHAAHTSKHGPIIHRDLKPLNILFDRKRQPKIADFGLAAIGVVKPIETAHPGKWEHEGTFGYKSPEQLTGSQLDPRCDLFNVGLISYLLFAGFHPFMDPRFLFDYREMVLEPYRDLAQVKTQCLPTELDQFILCLLAKGPDERFHSASEAVSELDHVEEKFNELLWDRSLEYHDALKGGQAHVISLPAYEVAKGISLCKRRGFFVQGAFLYEKSGIDLSPLDTETRQILDEDYNFCKRRAGQEVVVA